MRKIYDITWPMRETVAGWPGDTKFAMQWVMRQADGDSVNVGKYTLSAHTGTHADAPYHYDQNGDTIDEVPVTTYVGAARLVDMRGKSIIRVSDLAGIEWHGIPRILIRTGGWTVTQDFPKSIPVMDREVPYFLHEQGIILVGLDVPSVDVLDSKRLPIHHALGRHMIHILEGLDLRQPPPGIYELIALPLKIAGGDGAPVRAILRELDSTSDR